MENNNDQFELPFRQLLWHVFQLRKAEKELEAKPSHAAESLVNHWREKVDGVFKTIGVDDDTDLKTVKLEFITSKK